MNNRIFVPSLLGLRSAADWGAALVASLLVGASLSRVLLSDSLYGILTTSPILIQTLLVVACLVIRLPSRSPTDWLGVGLAIFPSLPLTLLAIPVREGLPLWASLIIVAGQTLTIWSLHSLGKRFGYTPCDRGLTCKGPYVFIRHPMYLGEAIMLLGGLFTLPPSVWLWGLAGAWLLIQMLRIKREENLIRRYDRYAQLVRWRLIPFVW